MCKTAAAAAAKSLQSCPTLCDPIDRSPPGSPAPGILQARTLEWVAISFSNAWKWKVKVKPLSHVRLLSTPWTAAYQAPPSMGFSRQEYWSGVPLPSPDDHTTTCYFSRITATPCYRISCWRTVPSFHCDHRKKKEAISIPFSLVMDPPVFLFIYMKVWQRIYTRPGEYRTKYT